MNLYKYILVLSSIFFLFGCSSATPKLQSKPLWVNNLPKNNDYFYAVASANSYTKAKNIAIFSLRKRFKKTLDKKFLSTKHPLTNINRQLQQKILKENEKLTKKFPMRGLRVIDSQVYNNKTFILIALSKKILFEYLQQHSQTRFANDQKHLKQSTNLADIQKFIKIKPLLQNFAAIASYAQFKKLTFAQYDTTKEFNYLQELYQTYEYLRTSISFHLVSDAESVVFAQTLKNILIQENLPLNKHSSTKNSIQVFISSVATNSKEYEFSKVNILLKLSSYDIKKHKIAFKQHTFVGRSRRGFQDAKQQAVEHMSSKIKRFRVFDFLGLSK